MNQKSKIDRQREHQANERTFLAWLRTSIALITFGFAIARFGLFLRQIQASYTQNNPSQHALLNSENLGIVFIVLGIVTIALAAWRYGQVFWQIERGDYRPSRLMVWVMTASVMILGILSLPLILWRNLDPNSTPMPQRHESRNYINERR
jgi:putative membrane protein